MGTPITCAVTIHGIGFQQAPLPDGTPGYADGLHERLSKYLYASLLGDDPKRQPYESGGPKPVYVASEWPPRSHRIEQGLGRVGSWTSRAKRIIDTSDAPLTDGQAGIAHVALVYSRLQDLGPHPGAGIEATGKALLSAGHYTSVLSLVRTALVDAWAVLRHPVHEIRRKRRAFACGRERTWRRR